MIYRKINDHPPLSGWNKPCPGFGFAMNHREECEIAFALENTYFGTEENKVEGEKLIELGRCFAKALKRYIYKVKNKG